MGAASGVFGGVHCAIISRDRDVNTCGKVRRASASRNLQCFMLTFLVSLPELSIEFIDLDTNFD